MRPEHKRYILKNRATPSGPSLSVPPDKKKLWLSVFLIVCVGGMVYANALKGAFLWDDSHLVQENRYLRHVSDIPKIFTTDIGAGGGDRYNFYRPLQILAYMLEYSVWKLDPVGYHLGNIIIHVLTALALFWFIGVLFRDHLLALLAGLLFVAHPVHTEAVTYIAGLADPLSAFFILLAFIFYIKATECRKAPLFLAALLSYAAALLSKENSLILPVLLVLYHYAFRKKVVASRLFSMTGLAALYVVLRLTLLKSMLSHTLPPTTLLQRLPGFFAALASYLRILFLPFRLHMEYGVWNLSFVHPQVVLGLLIFLAALLIIFRESKKRTLVFFSLSWFFLTLLPVSNLYPVNAYMAEHWLYLPSIGFFLVVAKGFSVLLRRGRTKNPARIGLAVLTVFWGVLTVRQNATWQEPIAFFERTLRYAPNISRLHNGLGMAYGKIGEYKTAASCLERAVELSEDASRRDAANAYNNLAYVYDKLGRNSEAARAAEGALAIDAASVKACNNMAVAYIRLKKYEEAVEVCRKAIAIDPGFAEAYNTLGAACMYLGRYPEAAEAYRRTIETAPGYAEAYNNLGLVLQKMGRPDEAVPWHEKAIQLRPDYVDARNDLADAYAALGRSDSRKGR